MLSENIILALSASIPALILGILAYRRSGKADAKAQEASTIELVYRLLADARTENTALRKELQEYRLVKPARR